MSNTALIATAAMLIVAELIVLGIMATEGIRRRRRARRALDRLASSDLRRMLQQVEAK